MTLTTLYVALGLAMAGRTTPPPSPGSIPAAESADTNTAADSAALQFPDTSSHIVVGGSVVEYLSRDDGRVDTAAKAPVVRVLFIGNSSIFENGMPQMFHDLMVANHHPCIVGMATVAGAPLAYIWALGRAQRVIRDYPWDYVILQEKTGGDTASFLESARRFHREIAAKHARTILFPQYYQDPEMRRAVDAANVAVGKALKAKVAPISAVWRAALASDASAGLFEDDGFHPSVSGAYLNALMMYQLITGESPVGLKQRPTGMSERARDTLERAAATTR